MIGGDIRGLGVARVLADKDVEVLLVEPSRELVTDIGTRSRRFQVGALEGTVERHDPSRHDGGGAG